jgi:hypothetical protein
MKRKKGRQRTITGIVVAEDWDENGNVIRVAIKTRDYQEYVVEHNKKGKELLAFVDNKLRFTGTVRERLDGDMIITVESYEPIKDNDEDEEDEYKEGYA